LEGLNNLLYVLFILLPGYIAYTTAGYSVDEKGSLIRIIYRGIAVFFAVNAVILILPDYQVIKDYFALFKNAPDKVNDGVFVGTMIIYVFAGFALGWLQLYLEYKMLWSTRRELKNQLADNPNAIEVAPGNNLRKIFSCYRMANKKPYVKLHFNGSNFIEGEVLKYNWNGRKELLIRQADTCSLMIVDLDNCYLIEFKNIYQLKESINVKKKDITCLDLIHPGLSELMEEVPFAREGQSTWDKPGL
jgi:hypothetical protein